MFLTPQAWKEISTFQKRKQSRWNIRPLLMVLALMTWAHGDTLEEKFESARTFYVANQAKRKRPGKTVEGFHKAVARTPVRVWRAASAILRQRILELMDERLFFQGFIPLGCDGSRLECPRTEELERRLPLAGKDNSAPTLWVTAFVHLRLGLVWCWRLGKGRASEIAHARQMLALLPPQVLIVADAAYMCYQLANAIMQADKAFLIRVYSRSCLYVDDQTPLENWTEGIVLYWPTNEQKKSGQPPLRLRLIRVPNKKSEVWMLTNVLDASRMSIKTAGRLYRWRWENEGYFRTYKKTLNKVKLMCRTVATVHREAEASMLACQLLLAQGALAMPQAVADDEPAVASPRKLLAEVRRELADPWGQQRRRCFWQRISQAQREQRKRTSAKEKRPWPRRKPHQPPTPPQLRRLNDHQKRLLQQHFTASGAV